MSAAIVSVSSNAMILGCNTVQGRVKENSESMSMLIPKGWGGGTVKEQAIITSQNFNNKKNV